MTCIDIIQDCAKRLGILIPKTIEYDTNPPFAPQEIDYDALLLLSLLNANLKRIVNARMFPQLIRVGIFTALEFTYTGINDQFYPFPNAVVSLIGEGVKCDRDLTKKIYFIRYIDESEFYKISLTSSSRPTGIKIFRRGESEPFYDEQKANRDNFPSEERTQIDAATNIESGVIRLMYQSQSSPPKAPDLRDGFLFCNHIFQTENNPQKYSYLFWSDLAINAGQKNIFSKDADTTILDDELLKLGVVADYKRYHGLDASADNALLQNMIEDIMNNKDYIEQITLKTKDYRLENA